MNFFERQQQVRRHSVRLVLLFAVAVVGIVATVDLAVAIATGASGKPRATLVGTLAATSLVTLTVIMLASLFRSLSLHGGGGRVAVSLGGVPVPADTRDPRLRRLRNVVEEIAIASGVPVPEIYVLDHEDAINAFAAGWSPADAAVAVTRGALERLNRDELQGVIAHEFSHVVNGDMRLNIRLIGLLFGILALAVIGRVMLQVGGRGGRGRNNRGAAGFALVGIALLVAGYIGVFCGRLIKAAVARQREYLADAAAVQFTRQTAGITGALKKIAGLPTGSRLSAGKTEEVSHMLFGPGLRLSSLLDTHPPLLKRIQVLDPSVKAAELEQLARQWAAAPPSGLAEDTALGLVRPADVVPAMAGAARPAPAPPPPAQAAPAPPAQAAPAPPSRATLPAPAQAMPLAPAAVVANVGAATGYADAGDLRDQVPPDVLARARRADTAVPLVLGLLLSAHPEVRAAQHAAIVTRQGPAVAEAAATDGDTLAGVHPLLRLPLAELAFPVLRGLPRPDQDALMATVHALTHADGRISVSEYCLSRLLHRELYESAHRKPPWSGRGSSLGAATPAVATLLAVLAQAGHENPRAAAAAFDTGVRTVLPASALPYAPPAHGPLALEPGWPVLDGLAPNDKAALVASMVAVIGADGTVTVAEFELVRTICAILHCPVPPLLASGSPA
jgi:Zn-dependent protease with chaperone function